MLFTQYHYTSSNLRELMRMYLLKGDRILDAGTGSGILLEEAARISERKVYGYDIDPEAVEASRRRVSNSDVYLADSIGKTPQRAYDAVLSNLDNNPALQLLQDVHPYLETNGYLIISLPVTVSDLFIESLGFGILNKIHGPEFNAYTLRKRRS